MGTKRLVLLIGLSIFTLAQYSAREFKPKSGSTPPKGSAVGKMADCNQPVGYTEFALNNVRFGLETGGQLWENDGNASYEVPKVDPESGLQSIHSIYAGGLWMGGRAPDGQLRVAAVSFRQNGTDFYNGPLTIDNTASATLCTEFDRHFFARKVDAARHRAYFTSSEEDLAELFPDGYSTPAYFLEWPGNNASSGYEFFLAPFFDVDGDTYYEPLEGDYPDYDLDNLIDCKTRSREDKIPLFGDETLWWVFNDNGGPHTEFQGERIGMEIQAQAFAYTTTDQINNMTFYNYVLINRGNQTLTETYFGQWCDSDLGCSSDDYVGCDVQRGLGFCYNGSDNDATCATTVGYGVNPPAVGIDFFEGPYQDSDNLDNPLTTNLDSVAQFNGIPYEGIGIGYGDGVVDNERFGMRKFVYYNIGGNQTNGDVNTFSDIYNYLNGIWKDGSAMTYGGNAVGGSVGTDYMFPGLTDPIGFATNGALPSVDWSEETEGNQPGDRRFIQSAGTFTLLPGQFNNITVGVVWARPFAGSDLTITALKIADDKAQSLFDNCFRLLSGPDAPDLSIQEMDRQLILYLTNENPVSNNYQEGYGYPSTASFDPLIPDIASDGSTLPDEAHHYEFQGYKIYQLKDPTVSSSDLNDVNLARLQFQVDIKDGVSELINWVDNPELGFKDPELAVEGADDGLKHSFVVTEDLFEQGADKNIVNFKKYYFMAVAYAYNEYEPYNPVDLSGQALPYIESRKSATGDIPVITAIPHKPQYESFGTVINSAYGDELPVTRIEGQGNGGHLVELSEESKLEILNSPNNIADRLVYEEGLSPIQVKIIDPLKVQKGKFQLRFYTDAENNLLNNVVNSWEIRKPELVNWELTDLSQPSGTIVATSDRAINVNNEQLLIDYGISITIGQYRYDYVGSNLTNGIPEVLGAQIRYEDSSEPWLIGVPDVDGVNSELNWIRSGTNILTDNSPDCTDENDPEQLCYYYDNAGADPEQTFEGVLNGWIAPWVCAATSWTGPCSDNDLNALSITKTEDINNIDIKITPKKEYWTRVPVLENQNYPAFAQGRALKNYTRVALSVDKNGKNQRNGGNYEECTMNGAQVLSQASLDLLTTEQKTQYKLAVWPTEDPASHGDSELLEYSFGMGWFPGYTIDIESGERLNMAFSENSGLASENGRDMLWNPTSSFYNGVTATSQQDFDNAQFQFLTDPNNARLGGLHYIYVFRNEARRELKMERMPAYDNGQFLFYNINSGASNSTIRKRVFRACTWVYFPLLNPTFSMLSPEDGLVPSEVEIKVRVAKPYVQYPTIADVYDDYPWIDDSDPRASSFNYFFWDDDSGVQDSLDFEANAFPGTGTDVPAMDYSENLWMPTYEFSTDGYEVQTNVSSVIADALDLTLTNVVPNPYYAFAPNYENTRYDNRVKVINLPVRCTIRIYDTGGILVRTIKKDSPQTFVEWDLKNELNVPIAGGVHIFHIEVPGVGEKVVKWFGVLRPIDLDNF